jgi:hypothetical protein
MIGLRRHGIQLVLVVIAFLMAVASPQRAHASVGACLNVLASPAKAAEIASSLSDPSLVACTGQLSAGDPVQIALLAVVTALALDGQFETASQCSYIANKVGAGLLKELASQSSVFKNALITLVGKSGFDQLAGEGADAAIGQLKQIPAIAALFSKFDCACLVTGTALQAKKIMEQVLKDTAACGGLVAGAGQTVINQFGVAGEKIHTLLHPYAPDACTTGSGGLIKDHFPVEACRAGAFKSTKPRFLYQWPANGMFVSETATYDACPPEWTDACGRCDMSKKPKGYDPKAYPGITVVTPLQGKECFCAAPAQLSYNEKSGMSLCACPGETAWNGKTCAPCPPGLVKSGGVCQECGKGGVFDTASGACKPKCKPGEIVGQGGACTTCPAGHYPERITPLPGQTKVKLVMSSEGKCTPCPSGMTAKPGDAACSGECPPGQEKKNGACFPVCPVGQIPVQLGEFKFSCESCPKGTWPSGTSCEPCPKGATWQASATGGECVCPAGQANREGVCYPCQGVVSTGPDGGRCTRCFEIGAVWNKDKATCETCPRGTSLHANICIPDGAAGAKPAQPKAPMGVDPGVVNRLSECPPGQIMARGQCIPAVRERGDGASPAPNRGGAACGPGQIRDRRSGACMSCPVGQAPDATGTMCEPVRLRGQPSECPPGQIMARGQCIPAVRERGDGASPAPNRGGAACGPGQIRDRRSGAESSLTNLVGLRSLTNPGTCFVKFAPSPVDIFCKP